MQLLFGNKAQVTLKKDNKHYYTENDCEVRIDFIENVNNIATQGKNVLTARQGLINRITVTFSFNEKIADLLFYKRPQNMQQEFLNVYEYDFELDGNDFYLADVAPQDPKFFFRDKDQNEIEVDYVYDADNQTVTIISDEVDDCYCFYTAVFKGATSYDFSKKANTGYLGIELLSEGNIDDQSCYSLLKFDRVGLGSYIDFNYNNNGIMVCDLVFNILDAQGSVTYGTI